LGLGPLQSAVSFASARSSLHRPGPFKKEPDRFRTLRVRLSWGSCPRGHFYVGCPFSVTCFLAVARAGRGSPDPRRCRPQGSCPSRRFRLARGSLEAFWTPPFAVAPDASRPCSMPLASLELPCRAFPSRGAVPALAGRCFLAGSLSDIRRRSALGIFTTAFTTSRRLVATRARPRADPGLMNQDDGSLRSLVRSPRRAFARRTCRPLPKNTGLAGETPARPLRSFAPPGSPFCDDSLTWPGRSRPSVLSWGSLPPELSPLRFGVRSLALAPAGGKAPIREHLRAPSHRGCTPRPGLRRLSSRAQDPSTRRVSRTPRITVRQRPSSRSASRTLGAPAASPVSRPAGR